MANVYEPRTNADAKATIEAELDKIMEDFSNSINRCQEAAEVLMSGSDWPCNRATKLKLKLGRSDLRGGSNGGQQADPRQGNIGTEVAGSSGM